MQYKTSFLSPGPWFFVPSEAISTSEPCHHQTDPATIRLHAPGAAKSQTSEPAAGDLWDSLGFQSNLLSHGEEKKSNSYIFDAVQNLGSLPLRHES